MTASTDVLCAGIIVADHVSSPIAHLPKAGELVKWPTSCLIDHRRLCGQRRGRPRPGSACGREWWDASVPMCLAASSPTCSGNSSVDVSLVQVTPGVDTSQTLIVNVAGEDRRFIHTFGANGRFRAADIPLDRAKNCRILYLGGYLLMEEVKADELAAVFAAARKAGVKTVLDVVTPGPSGDYLSRLEPLLPEVDVFLPNNHEAELITGECDLVCQAECFHRLGAKTTIITLGDRGAVLVGRRNPLAARRRSKVPFVDGSGGGDAFAAGYMAGLLEGLDPEGCLRRGRCGAERELRPAPIGTTTGVSARTELEEFCW